MKTILPILDNQIPKTISFSSRSNFELCSYYYLLVDIMRLKPWRNSPDTIFGTYIHAAVQDVIANQDNPDAVPKAITLFERKWKTFSKLYKKFLDKSDLEITPAGRKIIEQVTPALKKEFGNFKVLAIEERLSADIEGFPQKFKGFIDAVLEAEDGRIIILDFKTSNSSFFFTKYKDKFKDYQLTLYKFFYANAHNVDPDKIETYFIVLEKNLNSKIPVVPIRVTSGKIKIDNALTWLRFALSAINRKVFIRNRNSCMKFGENHPCVFMNTEYCKK